MVTLVVATTIDPASIGPASALLAMPGWNLGPSLPGMTSYTIQGVRLLKHEKSIVAEDHLDKRWEEATGETVDNVIFLSKHTAVSNRPALTVHPIGVPHLRDGEVPPAGGRPGWAAPPNPRMGAWLRLLKDIAVSHNLVPEFEETNNKIYIVTPLCGLSACTFDPEPKEQITLEATHHGPEINSPTMFVEIGSTEEYWKRQDAAQAIALLVWKGLGLDGEAAVGDWSRNTGHNKILVGIGGGHYAPRHMDIVMKDGVWVGHLLSGYALPMEEVSLAKQKEGEPVGGTWKEAIKVAVETTQTAFPGGEVVAHLDQKSFKGWQKTAITGFLEEQKIKIGKPADFH